VTSRFDRDTALVGREPHAYHGTIDRGWWVEVGPNGGYVAAIILRALTMEVDDVTAQGAPKRSPRSLTIHYMAPPVEGPVVVTVTVERQGGKVTFVTGRMTQGDRVLATAMAAFAVEFSGPEFHDLPMPDVPPPDLVKPWLSVGPTIELRDRYDMLHCVGAPPFTKARTAVSGGWIRLTDTRPVDHLLVAALTDAWIPPVFSRLDRRLSVPTVDLTIHFRAPLPHDTMDEESWCLSVFRSQVAAHGFIEEDGEVWSPNGVLLAHSRQLAVTIAVPE
jgi:acyl-CoA thioesterase